MAENDLEFLIPLPLLPKCRVYRPNRLCLVHAVLGIEPKSSCILGECPTNGAIFPAIDPPPQSHLMTVQGRHLSNTLNYKLLAIVYIPQGISIPATRTKAAHSLTFNMVLV